MSQGLEGVIFGWGKGRGIVSFMEVSDADL